MTRLHVRWQHEDTGHAPVTLLLSKIARNPPRMFSASESSREMRGEACKLQPAHGLRKAGRKLQNG